MGYNTTIFVRNDGFDQLEKHPDEFVRGINHHMHDGGDFGVGNHGNVVKVMRTQHADAFRLYVSEGNDMIELSHYSDETMRYATSRHDFQREVVDDAIREAKRRIKRLEQAIKEARLAEDGA